MNLENKKQIATILLAVGLGLVAAFLVGQYVESSVDQQTQALAQAYEKKLAEETKKRDAALAKELDIMKKDMQKFAAQAAAQQRVVQAPEKQPEGPRGAFSLSLPPGKRAITLMIDSLSAVGGLVNPGDSVDVIGQLNIPDPFETTAKDQKVTTVLFQNLLVLAVGTNFIPTGNSIVYESQQKARSLNVTLAVDPQEAGLLTFAQTNGTLKLALRSPVEDDTKILEIASWDSLSDYVLDKQGTELRVPQTRASIKEADDKKSKRSGEEVKPFIQIFRAGREQ